MDATSKILVIDDEVDICEVIQDTLSPHFSNVVIVHSAPDALAKIAAEGFDLIISDVMMPGMSGIDLLKSLRAKQSKTPVVFVSASDAEEVLVKALEYGAADFIAKPFEGDQLVNMANKMVKIGQLNKK